MRGKIEKKDHFVDQLVAAKLDQEYRPVVMFTDYENRIYGKIEEDKIRITCIPKDTELVRQHLGHLTEMDYE